MAANYNPPDSHWCDDFDARLLGTFQYLKEHIEALEARELERDQAVRDALAARDEAVQAAEDAAFLLGEMRK